MNADPSGPSLESIFAQALETTDPAERRAYLDRACGTDADIRQRVEQLLDGVRHCRQFSWPRRRVRRSRRPVPPQAPRANPADRHPPSRTRGPSVEGPGELIGPYKLLQEIGEGGMGVVYMAEQEKPVRRKVALKIIKPGMDTEQVDRPVRGRAAGPGLDGPPEHRQGARCRHDRHRPALLRHGAGQGGPDHRLLRRRRLTPASGSSCSSRSARRSSTPIRRGSSTATSSRRTCW